MKVKEQDQGVRYEADEKPSYALSLGLGFQLAILILGGIVFTPAIIVNAAGGSADYLSWAVFAAVAISGLTTILQAVKVGRFGSGYVLPMGTSGTFIAVCIAAMVQGGPAMLATLVTVSALFQFALAARLSLFRRILTPTVAGTVIMLIAVTVMPIVFDMLDDVPEGTSESAAVICSIVTLCVIVGIVLTASGFLRLWAPVIGIMVGSVLAAFYGIFDMSTVNDAVWFGLPEGSWPGLDLSFGPVFWALFPGFLFVTLVGAVETIGDSVAIQRVSWRKPRSVDYRAVQGAVAADGVGNLLSGLAATVPNTTYSTGVSMTELTGVAARRVGVALGLVVVLIAFLPKLLSLIVAIPGPIVATYFLILLSMLFVLGMKIIVQDGLNYRKAVIVGVSFWVGVGFQNNVIFPDHLSEFAQNLLQNGMTSGGLTAIILTLFLEAMSPRKHRLQVPFDSAQFPRVREFVAEFASSNGWGDNILYRLDAAAEETILTLMEQEEPALAAETDETRRAMLGLSPSDSGSVRLPEDASRTDRSLMLTAYREAGTAILEFVVGSSDHNLQDQMALLGERPEGTYPEREISLRLLRNLASSVHHQQYHNTDIVTISVETR